MQVILEANWYTGVVIGALAMVLLIIPFAAYVMRRLIMRLKVDMMQRLPLTLDQIDADKEVIRAHHVIELKRLELQIAEAQASEAEARAMAAEGLSRIDKLNRRIEVMQLKLAARGKAKDIRKVDEKLILLDSAKTQLDADVA